VEGAVVEIWHCDAEGTYSGYPEEITHDEWKSFVFMLGEGESRDGVFHVDPVNDNRFLRGLQRTDAEGWVQFDTIFPGWYTGRVPHIHAKIMISENEQLTTQFYFDTALCNSIYTALEPYRNYGASPMSFENDVVLSEGGANGLLLEVLPGLKNGDILESQARIGVQRA
jgi:protocatechuate 3,4-dioxygenase beta subunit